MRGEPDNRGDLLGPPKSFQPPSMPPTVGRDPLSGGPAQQAGGVGCAVIALVVLIVVGAGIGIVLAMVPSSTQTPAPRPSEQPSTAMPSPTATVDHGTASPRNSYRR